MTKNAFETAIDFAKKEKGRYTILAKEMPMADYIEFVQKASMKRDGGLVSVSTEVVGVTADTVHILYKETPYDRSIPTTLHYFIPLENILGVEVDTSFEFEF